MGPVAPDISAEGVGADDGEIGGSVSEARGRSLTAILSAPTERRTPDRLGRQVSLLQGALRGCGPLEPQFCPACFGLGGTCAGFLIRGHDVYCRKQLHDAFVALGHRQTPSVSSARAGDPAPLGVSIRVGRCGWFHGQITVK